MTELKKCSDCKFSQEVPDGALYCTHPNSENYEEDDGKYYLGKVEMKLRLLSCKQMRSNFWMNEEKHCMKEAKFFEERL